MSLATTPAQCSIVVLATALAACAGTWGSGAARSPRSAPQTQVVRVTSSAGPAIVYLDGQRVGMTPVDVSLRYRRKRVTRTQPAMISLGIGGVVSSPILGLCAYQFGLWAAGLSVDGLELLAGTAWTLAIACGVGAAMSLVGGVYALATSRKRRDVVLPASFTISVHPRHATQRYTAKLVGKAPFAGLRGLRFDAATRRLSPNTKPNGWLLLQRPADGPDEPGAYGAPK